MIFDSNLVEKKSLKNHLAGDQLPILPSMCSD